jgi:hypothetical protein
MRREKKPSRNIEVRDTPALSDGSLPKDGGNNVKEYTSFARPHHCQGQPINRIKHESPWKTYKSGYDLKLDHLSGAFGIVI